METFAERLSFARRQAGFDSPQAAAEEFGWNVNTYKSHDNGVRGGARGPNEATVRKYARSFRVDWVWLLTGEGTKPATRKAVVASYDPDVLETPIAEDEQPEETPRAKVFPVDAIKELASKAGMGSGQTITSTYVRNGTEINQTDPVRDDYWRLPPDFVRSSLNARTLDLLVIECTGDSMEPTLRAGDRVVANTSHKRPSPDGIYAIRNQLDDVVVKRIELFGTNPPRVRILSDNPSHAPQERGLDEIEIVGKIVAGLKLF